MSNIHKSIAELVGHTPLLELVNYEEKNQLKAKILGKLEYFNPSGSVKDRAALEMLEAAEASGELKPGCTPERIQIMKAYGTDVRGIMEIPGAEQILKEYGFDPVRLMDSVKNFAKEQDYFYVAQLFNENNPGAHYKTTGPELVEDTDGKIDIAVMLAGTAGTLAGVGSYLQEHVPGVQIVGVQPTPDSLSFVPDAKATIDGVVIFDKPTGCTHPFVVRRNFKYDEVINVKGEDAYATAREVAASDGVLLGASAAAALTAAKELALRPENEGKNIVAILADNGMKYLSTNMYK